MEKKRFRIGQFPDGQSNSVMGGSVLKMNQSRVAESVKPPKKRKRNIKDLLKTDARYTLRLLVSHHEKYILF